MLTAPEFYSWSFAPRTTPVDTAGGVPGGNVSVSQDITFGRTGITLPLDIRAGGIGRGQSFSTVAAPNAPVTRTSSPVTLVDILGDAGNYNSALERDGISDVRINTGHIWGMRVSSDGNAQARWRHRIYIPLEDFARNTAWQAGTGWIEIRNLWLIPDNNAAPSGEVRVDAQVGQLKTSELWGSPTSGLPNPNNVLGLVSGNQWVWEGNTWVYRYVTNATTLNRFRTPANLPFLAGVLQNGQRATGLHVGNRGGATLQVEVVDGPNDVRTGHLGTFRASNFVHDAGTNGRPPESGSGAATTIWRWNRDNEGAPYFEGVMTSTLIIEETNPGGFTTGFGAPINFQFLDSEGKTHPGIRILGMEARAGSFRGYGWTRGAMNNFWGGQQALLSPGTLPGAITGDPGNVDAWTTANQNWMNFRGWVSALDNRLPSVSGVGNISDTEATVYLPTQQIYDVASVANQGPGLLEVRFYLSVEAGYEWKYGSPIDVTISGSGVANLTADSDGKHTVTIANARDPIGVTLVNGSTPVESGEVYNLHGAKPVSDVIIDVVDNNAFNVGDELWMYVGTDTVGRNFDINLVNVPTVTVNEASGLRLDGGRLMNPTTGGNVGRAGIAFTVTRQPYGGAAPAPEITISNINVEGSAYPGVEYQLIFSGTGIANNDQEVFHATRTRNVFGNVAEAAVIGNMNRGIFTSLPYNETVLENVFGGLLDLVPGLTDTNPSPGLSNEFRMWAGMGQIAGVDEPFRWVPLAGTDLRVGFVSARAFAFFVNGSPDTGVDWNAATNTATISGKDVYGNNVNVVMTVGSNIAQVNGTPVDIATYANQSGPAGSIQVVPTPDGRIFLPLRFLANAFGRTVQAEGEVVVFR